MTERIKKYCPDCGPVTVSHRIERWNVRMDSLLRYAVVPSAALWRLIKPAIAAVRPGRAAPIIFKALAAVQLGEIIDVPDKKINSRGRILWEEAVRRGIVMKEFRPFGLPREIFFASWQGDVRAFDGLPRPRNAKERSLEWMDDKSNILTAFKRAGIPVPRGGACKTRAEALKIFNSINGPVIVKPAIGSRSRHTYLHITDTESLIRAFEKAKELSPRVVVEEKLPGFVFRVTLINGRIAGVMRREPPHVIGDGIHAVRELADEENKNSLRRPPIFHELDTDNADAIAELRMQNLSPDSIPEAGRMVTLHPKVSRSFGASMTELSEDEIHSDNREVFLKVAEVLDDPLFGVDFMIEDMSQSWHAQKCGVIECNSLPFIDLHHFPLKGKPKNAAGALWDMIFPESRPE